VALEHGAGAADPVAEPAGREARLGVLEDVVDGEQLGLEGPAQAGDEALQSVVPVYGESGPSGGYRLLDGYRTRLTGLNDDEARSLFLVGMPGPAAELGLGGVVAAAQLKLLAALPPDLRHGADHIRERFHLDTVAWYDEPDRVPHLATVADAVWTQRRVRMRYRRWAAPHEVDRDVDPYGLVLKSGLWYLVARDARQTRTYRVSRIVRLRVLDRPFERPPGFDLASHWRRYLEGFDARRHRVRATLRLSPEAAARLPQVLDAHAGRAARSSAQAPDRSGWTQVTIPVESVERAVPELLRLGAGAEVLAPAALRTAMTRAVRALAGLYGEGRRRPQIRRPRAGALDREAHEG
jgi:predicted DNA-binding transcriptional regulator YafY